MTLAYTGSNFIRVALIKVITPIRRIQKNIIVSKFTTQVEIQFHFRLKNGLKIIENHLISYLIVQKGGGGKEQWCKGNFN